jgi:hypothetical protein
VKIWCAIFPCSLRHGLLSAGTPTSKSEQIFDIGIVITFASHESGRFACMGGNAASTGTRVPAIWACQLLLQCLIHLLMKLILYLCVPLRVEVMLVRLQRFPPTLPAHVLDQLAESAIDLAL